MHYPAPFSRPIFFTCAALATVERPPTKCIHIKSILQGQGLRPRPLPLLAIADPEFVLLGALPSSGGFRCQQSPLRGLRLCPTKRSGMNCDGSSPHTMAARNTNPVGPEDGFLGRQRGNLHQADSHIERTVRENLAGRQHLQAFATVGIDHCTRCSTARAALPFAAVLPSAAPAKPDSQGRGTAAHAGFA